MCGEHVNLALGVYGVWALSDTGEQLPYQEMRERLVALSFLPSRISRRTAVYEYRLQGVARLLKWSHFEFF